MKLREEKRIIPPKIVLINALTRTLGFIPEKISDQYDLEKSIMFTHLQDALRDRELSDISDENLYLEQLKMVIIESFIPAFTNLAIYLEHLIEISEDQIGLYHYANGEDYYEYLINHYTGIQLSAEQISALAKEKVFQYSDQLKNFSSEVGMNGIDFGYGNITFAKENQDQFIQISPQFPSLIYNQKRTQAHLQVNSFLSEKLSILKEFPENQGGIEQAFNPLSKENFQINDPWIELSNRLMTKNQKIDMSLVFSNSIKETLEQYLLNVKISNHQDGPLFRRTLQFPGYFERWQSYFIEDDLSHFSIISQWDKFSIIQRELYLSACLMVDIGIHKYGWTIGESKDFIEKTTALPDGSTQMIVERIVQNPGQITIYIIGKQQMQNLEEQLKVRLNEKYVPKEFNDWLIAKSEMPFSIMEDQTKAYIIMYEKMDLNNIQP